MVALQFSAACGQWQFLPSLGVGMFTAAKARQEEWHWGPPRVFHQRTTNETEACCHERKIMGKVRGAIDLQIALT